VSKKRSKKFGKKRAPAAIADGGEAAGAHVEDTDDTESSDSSEATQADLLAAEALPADAAVVAEDAVAPATVDDAGAAHVAPTTRSKKAKKSAASVAASDEVAAVEEIAAAVDADSADAVAAVDAGVAVEKTSKAGKKAKASKAKGKASLVTAELAADAELQDADLHDVDAGGAADGIDVDMAGADAPTPAELAAAGYGDDGVGDELVADAIDGIDVEMPLLDGDSAELAVEGEGDEVESELPAAAAAMDATQLAQLIEALIFATDKPLTLQRIRQLTRVADVNRITAALAKIAVDYADRGIVLSSVSGGYQFRTRSQFSSWVQQLIAGRPVRLSRAQLEALAIIAYRQPITRPEIDEIRGVDSGGTLKVLLDRQLIRSLGKKEEVGRPVLYGTTKEFLDFFSLGDLRELPTLREYSELTDESRSVMKKMGLDAPEGAPAGGPQGLTIDDAAAFEALANAAEIANEFDDIGEVGDLDEVNDYQAVTQFEAASDRSGVLEDAPAGMMAEAADELDARNEPPENTGEQEVLDDPRDTDDELAADAEADADAGNSQGFDPTNLTSVDDDDEAIELPSWVVPVADAATIEIENQGPAMVSREHGDGDEDAADVEVTRDGEWVAGASELVEPTDDVPADHFDDDVS
jgi:segregation and condensation protein B